MLQRNYDPRPTRVRIMEKLIQQPSHLWTTAELAENLHVYKGTISPIVSKIHMYGGPIEKVGHHHWKLRSGADLKTILAEIAVHRSL